MTLLTSYFVSKQRVLENTEDAFLSLSKGKSLDNRPVFDLWVFENGQVLYKGIENVGKIGVQKSSISLDVVSKIKSLINQSNQDEIGDAKGRDNPLTIIKHNGRKIVFQASRVKGNLLELNNLLEDIAAIINDKD